MPDTKTKMIAGEAFEISQPYAAGHVLNEAEAKTLNQVRSENIGNNVREKVKELLESGKLDEAKALVAEKDASYEFTLASASTSVKLDPVEREARSIAKDIVKAKLAEKGLKWAVPPEGETKESWAEKLEANVEKFATNEAVLKEAKKAVEAKKKRLDALGSLDVA
jgi:hypothetical protein